VKVLAEYIWIDGQEPTAKLRSKTKVVDMPDSVDPVKFELPKWGFDGSSTEQAEGNFSDCGLIPVKVISDPVRLNSVGVIALCEVTNADGSPHVSNGRHILRDVETQFEQYGCWGGLEQEYTLYQDDWPLGWPKDRGFPSPQGRYYCGVGHDEVHGRPLVEDHLESCLRAGLNISGINAEVMPGQWEFQVGPLPPVELSDQLWLARWLLYRIGEHYNVSARLDPKPMSGNWNGAGLHTNFSTIAMREGGEMLRQEISRFLDEGVHRVLLDFEEVPYVDSACMYEIVRSYTSMARENGTVALLNLTKRIDDLLSILKLKDVFPVFTSKEDALQALRDGTWT